MHCVKFIDLFSGMGGFRVGFEQAVANLGLKSKCVFSSEIKPHALKVYSKNFQHSDIHGDITLIDANQIPDFDVLLAGFPCQAFSSAGKRHGFLDTRGTLFFDVERILKEKKPDFFILENVDGLLNHDKVDKNQIIGRTMSTILAALGDLGYKTNWKVLDSSLFGLAQSRKRVFIVGSKQKSISLDEFEIKRNKLGDILESGKPLMSGKLIDLLLSHYEFNDLYGKSVKDKRGGENNIHSWDIGLKGEVSFDQKVLLEKIMRARRSKSWAEKKGIRWMDGMPLTLSEIASFYQHENLKLILDDLVAKGYVKYEHPKDIVQITDEKGNVKEIREYRTDLEKGYNIVAGKLSYDINKILDPNCITPTLVATDLDRVVVPDGKGLRQLTPIEKKRLFGFPDSFNLDGIKDKDVFDLFGNTVPIPVVKAVSERVIADWTTVKRPSDSETCYQQGQAVLSFA